MYVQNPPVSCWGVSRTTAGIQSSMCLEVAVVQTPTIEASMAFEVMENDKLNSAAEDSKKDNDGELTLLIAKIGCMPQVVAEVHKED